MPGAPEEANGEGDPERADAANGSGETAVAKRRRRRYSQSHVRQYYDTEERELQEKRVKIENPDEDVGAVFDELRYAFSAHARHSTNSEAVFRDQELFTGSTDFVTERMRNQVRSESSEVTVDLIMNVWRHRVRPDGENLRQIARFGRTGGPKPIAIGYHLPQLQSVQRRQIARGPRVNDRPRGAVEEAPVVDRADLESEADIIAKRTQAEIERAVSGFAHQSPGTDLLLYYLVFDKHSFVRTLENFFQVSVMVNDGKLRLGADKSGLPTVLGVDDSLSDEPPARQQVNFNFNNEVYEEMQRAFGTKERMIQRNDYDDEV